MQEGAHQKAPISSAVRVTGDNGGNLDGSHSSSRGASGSSKAPGVSTAARKGGAVFKRTGTSDRMVNAKAESVHMGIKQQQEQVQQQWQEQQHQQLQLQARASTNPGMTSKLDTEGAELTICKPMQATDGVAGGSSQSWSSNVTHTSFAGEAAASAALPACQDVATPAGQGLPPLPGGLCASGSAGSCGFDDTGMHALEPANPMAALLASSPTEADANPQTHAPPALIGAAAAAAAAAWGDARLGTQEDMGEGGEAPAGPTIIASAAAASAAALAGGDAELGSREEMGEGGDGYPNKVQTNSKVEVDPKVHHQAPGGRSNSSSMDQVTARRASFLGEGSGLAGGSCTSSITNSHALSCLAPPTPGETSLTPPSMAGPGVNVEAAWEKAGAVQAWAPGEHAGLATSTWASESPRALTAGQRGFIVPPLVPLEPPNPSGLDPHLRPNSSQLLLPPVLCPNPANRGGLPGVVGVSAAMDAAVAAAGHAAASMAAVPGALGGGSVAMDVAVAAANRSKASTHGAAVPGMLGGSAAMGTAVVASNPDGTCIHGAAVPGVHGGSAALGAAGEGAAGITSGMLAGGGAGGMIEAECVRQGLVAPGSPVGGHVGAQDFALATMEVQRQHQHQQQEAQEYRSLPSPTRSASLGTQQELWHAGAETARLTQAQAEWSQSLWSKQQQQQQQVPLPGAPPIHTPPVLPLPQAMPPNTLPHSNTLSAPLPKPLPLSAASASGWRVVPDAELAALLPSYTRSPHTPFALCNPVPGSAAAATPHASAASALATVPMLDASPALVPPPATLPPAVPNPATFGHLTPPLSVAHGAFATQHVCHTNSAPLPLLTATGAPPALSAMQQAPWVKGSTPYRPSCMPPPPLTSPLDPMPSPFNLPIPAISGAAAPMFPPNLPQPLPGLWSSPAMGTGTLQQHQEQQQQQEQQHHLAAHLDSPPRTQDLLMADGMSITGCESNELMVSAASAASNAQHQQQQEAALTATNAFHHYSKGSFPVEDDSMVIPGTSNFAGPGADGRQLATEVDLSVAPEELMGGGEGQGAGLDGECAVPEARLASLMLDSLEEALTTSSPL